MMQVKMQVKKFIRLHGAALLFVLCLAFFLILFAYYVSSQVCDAQRESYIACGGWIVTVLAAWFAATRVREELGLREWWRIREREEASEEHAKAKRTIARLIPSPEGGWRGCQNRYEDVWARWKCLTSEEDRKELDKARRRLSHFWVDVVELVTRRILTPDEVWRAVGDPEFVFVLEPLEVFKAAKPKQLERWPWEAVKALGWWLELEKKDKEAAKVWKDGRIPVEPKKLQELDCD